MDNHCGTPIAPYQILFLIDNRPLRRAQLLSFLRAFAEAHDLRIVEFTVPEQLSEGQSHGPGLCVLNAGSWASEGDFFRRLEALHQADPSRRLVVVSDISTANFVKACFQAGSHGVIPTSTHPDIAQRALDFVLNGGSYIPPSALDDEDANHVPGLRQDRPHSKLAPPERKSSSNGDAKARSSKDNSDHLVSTVQVAADIANLTPRQGVVLEHLRQARSNKEIARCLDMSEATVKLHIRQIMRKLGAKNRTDAALIAAQLEANFDTQRPNSLLSNIPGYEGPVIATGEVKRGPEGTRPISDGRPPLTMIQAGS